MNVIAQAARDYIGAGAAPIRVPLRSKSPDDRNGWQNERWTVTDVSEQFPKDSNIGLLVGKASNGWVDVDLDCPAAIALAPAFLPSTPFIHGRASAPRSHWWYIADPVPKSTEFRDSESISGEFHGTKVLELRASAGQTIVPPSIHPSGEQLIWEATTEVEGAAPAKVAGDELTCAVRTLGAAIIAQRHYPATGDRHGYALALAGFLLRQPGWDAARVSHFVQAVASAAGDDESKDRLSAVETTAERLASGETATGGGELRKIVGNAVFDAFCTALGLSYTKDTRGSLPLIEAATVADEVLEDWPAMALQGDYIADLTDLLTDGTPIPKPFVREGIIVGLGALCDQILSYPLHHDLTVRRYMALVSENAQAGKGASTKRTLGPNGVLRFFLDTASVKVLNGSCIGSGQFLAKKLEESPRLIVIWDEASGLFQQTGQLSSTLLSALKSLYEDRSHWSGSFTNRQHGTDDAGLSVVLQSTRKTFVQGFATRGGISDGLLSRFIFSYASAWPVFPEWTPRDYAREQALTEKIIALIPKTPTAPGIDDQARKRLADFVHEVNGSGRPHPDHTPRLLEHTKVDVLMRCIFSGSKVITLEMVERAVAWARHQLKLRLAFWPPDAQDQVTVMTQTLLRRLQKGSASDRDLRTAANVQREGNHELFARAKSALLRSGELIVVGKNRKGQPVYALESDDAEGESK